MRIFTILFLFFSLLGSLYGQIDTSNIRWVLGGVINYSNTLNENVSDFGFFGERELENRVLKFIFDPYFTYSRNEKWEMGVGVHFYRKKVSDFSRSTDSKDVKFTKHTDIGIGIQLRRNFFTKSRISVYLQSRILRLKKNFEERKVKNITWTGGNTWMNQINIISGVSYDLRKHLKIIVNYGKFDYSFGQIGTFEKNKLDFKPSVFVKKDVNSIIFDLNYFSFGIEYLLL